MISIVKASEKDYEPITSIGLISVEEAHRDSCSVEEMNAFLDETYNHTAIRNELKDTRNLYHLLNYNGNTAGFSKIILNAGHDNIQQDCTTKLDRIYLLKEYFDLKLGIELLNFNINLAREHRQCGMWLFTWVGNRRAVNFYLKAGFEIVGSHRFKVTETHYNEHHQMFLGL